MSGAGGIVRIPELRKRILFSLLILAVYRLGVHVPTPGVDSEALKQVFQNMQGTVFGWFNLFSGGALEQFSIFALGVMPYISASIIFQLLTVMWPYLAELQKEGETGRKKITQYTRYATVGLALFQGFGIATGLEQYTQQNVVLDPGFAFRIMTAVTLTTGTVFLMWMGEQITERGIGNGISLLIFAGIAARIPSGFGHALSLLRSGELSFFKVIMFLAIIIGTFYAIIFVERGARRIPIHYAKRVVGRKIYGGQNTNLPLKVNTAGVIPPIFASSLIMFPATIATFVPFENLKASIASGFAADSIIGKILTSGVLFMQQLVAQLAPGAMLYEVLFVSLIILFAYFYTAVTFKTDDIADNLRKYGGFIPGIRPGPATSEYIDYVLSRITLVGALYITVICVLPTLITNTLKVQFFFGGTSILILVGVALDTVSQVETYLLQSNYEGFMKHTRLKGRAVYS